jgi:acetylornithine deacetylase
MARLATLLDHLGKKFRSLGPAGMTGLCLNVAALEGGVAFNVIPSAASLLWSIRPWPGFDRATWDALVGGAIAALDADVQLEVTLDHAPFAGGGDALRALVGGHAREFRSLDFWTEAALYQEAGVDALVIGPGDIAQAHGADEYVTLGDLRWAVDLFTSVLEAHGG